MFLCSHLIRRHNMIWYDGDGGDAYLQQQKL
jgi:hypothetical protein